jgi:pimeloyl-ACP methyl ester carboxylesterase
MIAFSLRGNSIWNCSKGKNFEKRLCSAATALPQIADRRGRLPNLRGQLQAGFGGSHGQKDRARIGPKSKRWENGMPTIDRDGVEIYYEVHGNGPTLILTHGYSSTSEMWKGQIEALSKHHKLVLWDMRGHGRSDYPEDPNAYGEALTIADIAALLDKVGANSAIVGGMSLGGYMSLAFYCTHPERVRALLIIDTGPGFKKDDARAAWNKRAFETADRFERDGLAALKSASRERSAVSHRDAAGLARAARGMLTQRDARVIEVLPEIKVPSLIVVGADDAPFLAASDYMAAKIPGAKKVVILSAGHAVNIDQPQAFIDAVLPFLDGLPRVASSGI